MKQKNTLYICIILILFSVLALPQATFAQYVPLVPLPGLDVTGFNLEKYLKTIYKDEAVIVFELQGGWARISSYTTDANGKREDKNAQWVYGKFLSSEVPEYKYK